MNATVVKRVFWKELRTLRSLWVAVACLAVGLQLIVTLIFRHPQDLQALIGVTFFVGYAATILYAIATAAASFTSEVEGRTVTLLRTVPVTRLEAFLGKWGFGLASMVGLLVLLTVIAAVFCAIASFGVADVLLWNPAPQSNSGATEQTIGWRGVWIGILVPIELFAFGVLFSLLSSDVLVAAICGSLGTVIVAWAWDWNHPGIRTVMLAGVITIDFWLTDVWLRRGTIIPWKWSWPITGWVSPLRMLRAWESAIPWRRLFQRLVWKELRQGWPYAAICALAATAAATWTVLDPLSPSLPIIPTWIAAFATPLLMGVAAYHVDQKGCTCRLFGEHGVTPDGTWVAKHSIWLSLTLAICAYVLVADQIAWGVHHRVHQSNRQQSVGDLISNVSLRSSIPLRYYWQHSGQPVPTSTVLGIATLYILVAYSIGQCLSLITPKALVAFGLGSGGISFVCVAWLIFATLGVPIVWTIGAVPLVLLGFTWARSGSWQIQRAGAREMLRLVAWFSVPTALIGCGVILYRILEISAPYPAYIVASQRTQPADGQGRPLWLQAADACMSSSGPGKVADARGAAVDSHRHPPFTYLDAQHRLTAAARKWLDEQQQAISLALEAARHEPIALSPPDAPHASSRSASSWLTLATLLSLAAHDLESKDKLAAALQHHEAVGRLARCLMLSDDPREWFLGRDLIAMMLEQLRIWAAHPKQTSDRVRDALRRIDEVTAKPPSLVRSLAVEWSSCTDLPTTSFDVPGSVRRTKPAVESSDAYLRTLRALCPWETLREQRLVAAVLSDVLWEIATAERQLRATGFIPCDYGQFGNYGQFANWRNERRTLTKWILTTPTAVPDFRWFDLKDTWAKFLGTPTRVIDIEALRRMKLIMIALASYQREHGRLPVGLDELTPTYFDVVPVDPWTGESFVYKPKGVPKRRLEYQTIRIDLNAPFLMSAGFCQARLVYSPESTFTLMVPENADFATAQDFGGGPLAITITSKAVAGDVFK